MRVRVGVVGEFSDYVFVVVVAFDGDEIVLCRHRDRVTWETPGGHIEVGETPLEAARRELYEEAGIEAASLTTIADYDVDGVSGQVFAAEVGTRHPLPGFEMAETALFGALPEELTYPRIAPVLVAAARSWRVTAAQAQAGQRHLPIGSADRLWHVSTDVQVFAGLPVRDLPGALDWYATFFGRPADEMVGEEAIWQVGESTWAFVAPDRERAGGGLMTLGVESIEPYLSRWRAAGLEHGPVETYDNGVRHVTIIDPDGNSLSLAEAPTQT